MVLQQLDIFGNAKNITTNKKTVKSSKNRDDILLSQKLQKLDRIHTQIYDTLTISIFDKREIIYYSKTIVAYPAERQAEVMGTQLLDLDDRIKINEEWLCRNVR